MNRFDDAYAHESFAFEAALEFGMSSELAGQTSCTLVHEKSKINSKMGLLFMENKAGGKRSARLRLRKNSSDNQPVLESHEEGAGRNEKGLERAEKEIELLNIENNAKKDQLVCLEEEQIKLKLELQTVSTVLFQDAYRFVLN